MKVLLLGDCLEELKTIKENSIDSIVTDPPYGLSFMNKKWDYDVPSVDVWKECLRVLKPGGHLLSFSGSRTYHRMAVRIEDAGFEIRDQIMWVYGSGFPKSHNIGKAIDKIEGIEIEKGDKFNVVGGTNASNGGSKFRSDHPDYVKYQAQNEWEGWGTALKPAHEPIVLARKPLSEKTNAENVLRWGTGGLNIDESRIGETVETWPSSRSYLSKNTHFKYSEEEEGTTQKTGDVPNGRWPANIIFDEEAGQVLDQQSGDIKSTKFVGKGFSSDNSNEGWKRNSHTQTGERGYNDKGGASRFFYCPKASKKDRNEGLDGFEDKENKLWNGNEGHKGIGDFYPDGTERPETIKKNYHPTVKPTELMLYLIKLVTPKGGTVLDPFMGSGSTGKAAIRGGFDFVGIEKEEEYIKIAEARINNEKK
jgi:site-specific DNA-methyltransferase (adenine-specific)